VYLPGLAGPLPVDEADCPSLAKLLRGAQRQPQNPLAWPDRLAAELGCATAPIANAGWRADFGFEPDQACLRADPVHLRVDRDSAKVFDDLLLQISESEADSLLDSLNAHLAETGLKLCRATPARWYLSGDPLANLTTTPLPKVLGRNAVSELPTGIFGRDWARLHTELQMLLHSHPVNEARESIGQPTINSLWLWGEGNLPTSRGDWAIRSNIGWVRGLLDSGRNLADESLDAQDWLIADDALEQALLRGDPVRWQRELRRLEHELFAPLLARWKSGEMTALTVDAGAVRLQAEKHWWRRIGRRGNLAELLRVQAKGELE
jgi:hypothetical protein